MLQVARWRIVCGLYLHPRERILVAGFAEGFRIRSRWQKYVRLYAAKLCGSAIDPEELGDGHFQLTELWLVALGNMIEIDHSLNRALPKTRLTDHQTPAVVLN